MRLRILVVTAMLTATFAVPGLAATRQSVPAEGQPQAAAPAVPNDAGGAISAGQIQKWFEAYTVLQAQEALNLSEAQYGRFVTRLKAVQDTRRRHQVVRNQLIISLRKLTNLQSGTGDEAALADRLKALRDEDERAAADLKKAYEGVDETLDVRQQARFRIFEERMDQQKLELLMRTRQNARAAQRGRGKS
ncbi:MAG: hypothetical protein ABIQ52_00400 [Vicinamibacterales bacterium]